MILREYKTIMVRISDLADEPYWLNIQAQKGWIIRDTVPVPDSLYKNRIIVIWEREATTPEDRKSRLPGSEEAKKSEAQEVPAISPREAYGRYVQKRDSIGLDSCEDQSSREGNKKNRERYWNERD